MDASTIASAVGRSGSGQRSIETLEDYALKKLAKSCVWQLEARIRAVIHTSINYRLNDHARLKCSLEYQ
jgi:hypothetical protein